MTTGLPAIRGRVAYIFDEPNFDIDQIVGIENIKLQDLDALTKVVMKRFDPDFVSQVRAGDILVGGHNFGYGHPHIPPMHIMRHLGIKAVVAESFAPTYWSIEIAAGFPQIPCPGILDLAQRWDELEIDFAAVCVRNLATGASAAMVPVAQRDLDVLQAGGIVSFLRQQQQPKDQA